MSRRRSLGHLRHRVRGQRLERAGQARFLAWHLTQEGRDNANRLRALRGSYAGRRCVVMGNGPSLLKSDLNRLRDEVTIVSNAHYLIWDQLEYVPTFLAVEDPLVVADRAKELADLKGIRTIYPFDYRGVLGPASDERLFVHFPRHYTPFPQFSLDVSKRAYWGGTVTFLNLQLAHFLGCDPIVLIGFDHRYVVPEARRGSDTVIVSETEDVNHIHPDYFGPGFRWHDPNLDRMEASYACARRTLEPLGVSIFNATPGGALEVFERRAFDDFDWTR